MIRVMYQQGDECKHQLMWLQPVTRHLKVAKNGTLDAKIYIPTSFCFLPAVFKEDFLFFSVIEHFVHAGNRRGNHHIRFLLERFLRDIICEDTTSAETMRGKAKKS